MSAEKGEAQRKARLKNRLNLNLIFFFKISTLEIANNDLCAKKKKKLNLPLFCLCFQKMKKNSFSKGSLHFLKDMYLISVAVFRNRLHM